MDETSKPYDVLNLARYYKYIKNDDDMYMIYVIKAKIFCCMDVYNIIITDSQYEEADVKCIEAFEKACKIVLTDLSITTIENMIYCRKLLKNQ